MGTIVVDAATREILLSGGTIEIRDENGTVIGRAVRAAETPPAKAAGTEWPRVPAGYELIGKWPFPSNEEIDRIIREEKGYTIDQVLAHLRSLDNAR